MANWYVDGGNGTTTGWYAVAQWAATHAYTVGQIVRQLAAPAFSGERCFRCTTAGTSGSAEPAWNTGHSATTTDGGVTWTECTGQEAYQGAGGAGTQWAAPYRTIQAVATSSGTVISAGDNVFVGDDHNEVHSGGYNLAWPGGTTLTNVICVDHTKVPPGPGDVKTGATINSSGSADLIYLNYISSYVSFNGITFVLSNNTPNCISNQNSGAAGSNYTRCDNCSFQFTGSGGTPTNRGFYLLTNGQSWSRMEWNNCTVQLSGTQQGFNIGNAGVFIWRGGALTGTAPTVGLFQMVNTVSYWEVFIEGVDLSLLGASNPLVQPTSNSQTSYFQLKDCKLGTGFVASGGPYGMQTPDMQVDLNRCDSSTGTYRNERHNVLADLTTSTDVVRTGGASDGTTGVSHRISTYTTPLFMNPFQGIPFAIWNTVSGANVNVTVYGVINAAAVPNNDDVWIEAEYLSDSTSPKGSRVSSAKANLLATGAALTADTSAWDTGATARVNSHTYAAGDRIKLASNPGRIFFCTTAGAAAASEPGGYATAVDGGSVTDGAAVFRAGCRFLMSALLASPQPQFAGELYAYPKVAKASTTIHIDPMINLS